MALTVPSNMLTGYAAMPAGEKAAFRAAIQPTHHRVAAPELVYSTLPHAIAGDTASVRDQGGYLFLLKTNAPGTAANWVNMLTNQPPPES
ncbi:MAG: hypothetical protein V4726_07350 [Verrucomicrobiota bacterium]